MNATLDSIVNETTANPATRAQLRGMLADELQLRPELLDDAKTLKAIARRFAGESVSAPIAAPAKVSTAQATPLDPKRLVPVPSSWRTTTTPVIDPGDADRRAKLALDHVSVEMMLLDEDQADMVRAIFHDESRTDASFGLDATRTKAVLERYLKVADTAVEPASELNFA